MSLRGEIIRVMSDHEIKNSIEYPDQDREFYAKHPTWWFKFSIDCSTAEARKELLKMESEGIVMADRRQSRNTMWILTVAPTK